MSIHSNSLYGWHKTSLRVRFSSCLLVAVLFLAAFPSMAADAVWQGGASGTWGSTYTDNWSVYPSSTNPAKFGEPKSDPITVQVDEAVDANGIVCDTGRTAGLNFTGSGTISNYGGSLPSFTGGLSPIDWNVNIINKKNPTNVYGTNSFHKTVDCSGIDTIRLQSGSKATLCDSASLTGIRAYVQAGGALEFLDSSTLTLTKDLTVYSGASLKIADNAVLAPRGLALPFSKTPGVSDEWKMDGGKLSLTSSSGFNAAGKSLEFTFTNATKTVSGNGTIQMYKLDFSSASNTTLRLDGPDLYVRSVGGDYHKDNYLYVTGGSTLGTYGADVNFSTYYLRFVGSTTIDTTDYSDKTTPRTITLTRIGSCSGDLDVKGDGMLKLGGALTQPNLNLTLEGGTTFDAQSVYIYALGDFVLKDNASFRGELYIGHAGNASQVVKSLTMSGNSTLNIGRYADILGDVTLSGNASAVIRNYKKESNPLSCANLSLSGNASLTVMTGTVSCAALTLADSASLSVASTISATSLTMSGDAHLAFTAGTTFTTSSSFGDGNWTMDITIPANYEAGFHSIVRGAAFDADFVNHVTLAGETNGWSVSVVDGLPVLYKAATPSGIEWTGGSETSDNWSDSANWNGGVLPGENDHVAFGGITRTVPFNNSLNTASGLVFRASAGPFTLTGSVEQLTLKTDCNSRGSATEATANIVSHSGFTQTIAIPITFPRCAYVLSDGGAEVVLKNGFYQGTATTWQYFIAGGEVAIGGTCSASKLGFRTAASGKPTTCLRLLPGCDFTLRSQGYNSFTEQSSYIGRLFIEEGATMTVNGGECSFYHGALDNVVNGVFRLNDGASDTGRIVASFNEQYYTGSGTIYAVRAKAGKNTGCRSHYVNFGGSLKLYMGGDWNTASYFVDTNTPQDPNCPTRFRMTDGTTLGATANWTYGPTADAFTATNEIVTATGRASVMTGTVTVNTQNPTNDAAHTITFVDPLDASDATVVKTGAGTLAFQEAAGSPSQISNLVVNAGSVVFAAAPTLSGTLTISSETAKVLIDGETGEDGWVVVATAPAITGPGGKTQWSSDGRRSLYKIVSENGVDQLKYTKDRGLVIIFY